MPVPDFSKDSFDAALWRLVARAQTLHDEMIHRIAPRNAGSAIRPEPSKRYTRIWMVNRDTGGRSIYAFIDQQTGDIYKPDSYKKPAPKVRGNIFAPDNGFGCLGWSGAS